MKIGWLRTRAFMIAMALASAGCGGGGGTDNNPPPPTTTISKAPTASGDAQSGTVGLALTSPLKVLVQVDGVPKPGVSVAWTAAGTGAAMAPASSVTDADGVAQSLWTLPHAAGNATATAAVSGASGSPLTFSATAAAGPAAAIAPTGGNNQTAPVSTMLPNPLGVSVKDAFGNPVGGMLVTWSVTTGSGTVNPTTTNTNGAGSATTSFTLGASAGANQAQAAATGLAGSPVAFNATGIAPVATTSVTVGNDFFAPSSILVSAGATVTWTWTSTGAVSHSVQSTGSPAFTSSTIMTGNGSTYAVQFTTPGTYTYDCAVHGTAMSGTIIVQ